MSKSQLLIYVIVPVCCFLGIYGIFIAAKLKKTGWDIKGILIAACIILPIIGFITTLIVRMVRNKRLKKYELKEKKVPGILTSAGN
jgi:hypothetical protein